MAQFKEQDGGLFSFSNEDIYVGIDQSYSGFAVTAITRDNVAYHSWVGTSKEKDVERLIDLQIFLGSILIDLIKRDFVIRGVAMEGYAHGAKFGREQAGELGAAVKLALHGLDLDFTVVPPTNLKKFVTGNGGAVKKEQMLLQTYKKYGVEFSDNNMCDSYGLAQVIRALDSDQDSLLVYERDALEKLRGTPCPTPTTSS